MKTCELGNLFHLKSYCILGYDVMLIGKFFPAIWWSLIHIPLGQSCRWWQKIPPNRQ